MASGAVRTPESNRTLSRLPVAFAIAGSASSVPRASAPFLTPRWLETTMPSMPFVTARLASSTVSTPLRRIGPSHFDRTDRRRVQFGSELGSVTTRRV